MNDYELKFQLWTELEQQTLYITTLNTLIDSLNRAKEVLN